MRGDGLGLANAVLCLRQHSEQTRRFQCLISADQIGGLAQTQQLQRRGGQRGGVPLGADDDPLDVVIDGKRVMDMAGIGNTEDVVTYQISDDHYVAQVAITNIAEQMESMGIFGAADTEHVLEIVAEQYPLCQEAIWTYGAAETPSNLTVNLEPGSAALRQYTQFDATNPPVSAE